MSLIKSFIYIKEQAGYKAAINTSLDFLLKKTYALPYYVSGMTDYYFNPNAFKQSNIAPLIDNKEIRKEFIDNGFEVIDYEIDKAEFNQWLHEVNFTKYYSEAYGEAFTEKALEHYLSSKLLDLNNKDVFVDVAAASSPWYDLVEKRYKCKSFAVDLNFPKKDDPRLIECDATNMPFDDETIAKIALHCAYEVFENDTDIKLVKEANRVLIRGGKMVILPLYMNSSYYILSSPKANRKGIAYGKAKRVWRDDKYPLRFSRHYSVEAFKERVAYHKGELDLKIFCLANEKDMKLQQDDLIYVKFAACFTKKQTKGK
ncbi:methyltransferase domain-containing protein [Chloroflexota bacterium]